MSDATTRHLAIHGITGGATTWTPKTARRALDLYRSGLSIDKVAAAVGRPPLAVRKLLSRHGETREPWQTRALGKQQQERRDAEA